MSGADCSSASNPLKQVLQREGVDNSLFRVSRTPPNAPCSSRYSSSLRIASRPALDPALNCRSDPPRRGPCPHRTPHYALVPYQTPSISRICRPLWLDLRLGRRVNTSKRIGIRPEVRSFTGLRNCLALLSRHLSAPNTLNGMGRVMLRPDGQTPSTSTARGKDVLRPPVNSTRNSSLALIRPSIPTSPISPHCSQCTLMSGTTRPGGGMVGPGKSRRGWRRRLSGL